MFMPMNSISVIVHAALLTNLRLASAAVLAITIGMAAANAQARDHIHIVGSSTVYPFVTVVAEKFGKSTNFRTPIIEATGSGGGLKLFCAGVGAAHADFANTSRRIKKSELEKCKQHGVTDIIEIKIGYDGIVLANSKAAPRFSLTRKDIFRALAKQTPKPNFNSNASGGGELLARNAYVTWAEVNAALPADKIEVLGPPPTSGTRDAFVELAMEEGCSQVESLHSMRETEPATYKVVCHQIREDGAFIEAGENDNLLVRKLVKNPKALGIFGFSFLDQNTDVVQGSLVDGVPPEFENIADGSYPISRPLYVYAKAAHLRLIPGMAELMAELTDEDTWGDEGYLAERGLIPMPPAERAAFRAAAQQQTTMQF